CLGCDLAFHTYSLMISHLESGTCDSGIDQIDLNETTARCKYWSHFIDRDYVDDLLERQPISSMGRYADTCDDDFDKLSALFKHVESHDCDQTLEDDYIRKLMRWLEMCHGDYGKFADKRCAVGLICVHIPYAALRYPSQRLVQGRRSY
ncbi:hypothetical protein EJ04DRAFT_438743, partial [Polyplosphaeria fusca]